MNRVRRRLKTADDSREQEISRRVCRGDVVRLVNDWCDTYDPRLEVKTIPFDLFPRQEEFLRWLQEREAARQDGLVEKSRDMGITWLCCAYALHGWLFRPGFAVGFGSRKLELVDRRGDLDSIFEKIRFMLYRLPAWMRPAGFKPDEHDNVGRIVNPANGASITGEGGPNIGRGGRKTLYFVDEAAYLEHPDTVERSLSETTNVRIDVSTPNGPGNPFATKRFSGKVPVFTFHWRQDPRKDDAWYAKKKAEKDPVTVAQEIDLDYTASVEGITIPAAWVRAAVGFELPRGKEIVAGLDIADEGANVNVLIARAGPVVLPPISWSKCNTTETAWKARDEATKLRVKTLYYDAGGVGAGVKGTWMTAERKLPFEPYAVQAGESPTATVWPDGKTSKELFTNLKAEMWWTLRRRFEKTFEYVEKGIEHPLDELISLPDCPQLIAELSLPLHQHTETGKIQIEKKETMRRRGVKSPDYADALCLAFFPLKKRRFEIY